MMSDDSNKNLETQLNNPISLNFIKERTTLMNLVRDEINVKKTQMYMPIYRGRTTRFIRPKYVDWITFFGIFDQNPKPIRMSHVDRISFIVPQ